MNNKSTSWGKVSSWYDELLSSDDSYQKKVILPNLLRVLKIEKTEGNKGKKKERILDLGCGQGFFSREMAEAGAEVTGLDISKELIKIAKARNTKDINYLTASADTSLPVSQNYFDTMVIVLALQNMKDMAKVFGEGKRVLKDGGRIVLVINHPVFRVPKGSDWYFDESKKEQGRVVYEYMSEKRVEIVMNPGLASKEKEKAEKTYSFHRPLQLYFKEFRKNGFAVTALEEWISHKESQSGPRKLAEDKARKEVPIFMMIEARKI